MTKKERSLRMITSSGLKCDICGNHILPVLNETAKRWSYDGFDNTFHAHQNCYDPIHGLDMIDALKKLPIGPLLMAIEDWLKTQPVGPVKGAQPTEKGA
jgi:hypothetical protein